MFRRAVCSAAAATAVQARTIYEYKFGQTPLSQPFKRPQSGSMPRSADSPVEAAKAGKVEVTKLHNGVRVISQNLGGPVVSIGAYIAAGPAYDPANCPGVGSLMHLALTTSNFNNSLFQLDRNIRSVGAAESHFEQYKHYIGIRLDSRADKWKSSAAPARRNAVQHEAQQQGYEMNLVQDNIFTCIAAPRFHEADIERFRDTIDNQLKELRWQYPAQYARQMLETVAFYREPLGNPSFVPENNNSNITSKVLLDQYARYVVPSRIVIAGVNVEHAALIAEYENTPYTHSETAPHHAKVLAESKALPQVNVADEMKQYTGGERQDHEDRAKEMGTKPDMDSEAICAVGWLAFGRDRSTLKDYAASLVVKNLMDMQFHDGVRYARDETHVHSGVRAFYNPYNTAGLMGITVTAEPHDAVKMVTDTVKAIKDKRSAAQPDVDIAKKRAAIQFRNQHSDNIRDYCDYLGTCLPIAGDSTTAVHVEDVVSAIQSVGAADVKKVYDCMFGHPTSFYGHGEMMAFPSVRQMGL